MTRIDPGHEGEIDTEEREDPSHAVVPYPDEEEDGATTTTTTTTTTTSRWCPKQMIYIGGTVPANNAKELDALLSENDGKLRVFGYGSLCWKPGDGATLSKFEEGVTTALGRAKGWNRCWAQRSADHRGTPLFPGLVCTLLTDGEVRSIRQRREAMRDGSRGGDDGGNGVDGDNNGNDESEEPSMTEGLIYTLPPHLVEDCLSELDFREKGGYERDIIDVVEDESGATVRALLYRGTPDNPAFWTRAMLDMPLAAAVMACAVGPSGPNDRYLYNLEAFLRDAVAARRAKVTAAAEEAVAAKERTGDSITMELANMARTLNDVATLYFAFGAGSDQHGQLRLQSDNNAAGLVNGDEARDVKEIAIAVPKRGSPHGSSSSLSLSSSEPRAVYAGGGHSAILTRDGRMYLWGWNENGQLGRDDDDDGGGGMGGGADIAGGDKVTSPLPILEPLGIDVESASLGHSHTAVIEAGTQRLYVFGDNSRGQVDGLPGSAKVERPTIMDALGDDGFVDVSAGLFHTAAVSTDGDLVLFGDDAFGQCGGGDGDGDGAAAGSAGASAMKDDGVPGKPRRWRPGDGSRIIKVTCGRRHTVALDEHGRVWTCGEKNGYGQLGRGAVRIKDVDGSNGSAVRKVGGTKSSKKGPRGSGLPQLVPGVLGQKGSGCYHIDCGWSHCVALVKKDDGGEIQVYGWGRNDRGQLGTGGREREVCEPRRIILPRELCGNMVQAVSCGAESTMLVDERGGVWGTGWNEHGNLGIGGDGKGTEGGDLCKFTRAAGERITRPPPPDGVVVDRDSRDVYLLAAGGAHFLAMKTVS